MAREVESIHQFEHSQPYGLNKHKTVVRCDDGAIYEFEQADGRPEPRLVRGFQPDGDLTHVSGAKILPSAVEETVSAVLSGWSK